MPVDIPAAMRKPANLLRGSHGKQLVDILKSSALLVVTRVIGMGSGLLLMIMLARTLAPGEFGQLTLTFSVALIGGVLVTINYGAGALRFLTGAVARDDLPAAAGYIHTGRQIVLVMSVLIWASLLLALASGQRPDFASATLPFFAGLCLAPFFGWLRVNAAYVGALGFVIRGAIPNTLIRQVIMATLVAIGIGIAGTLSLPQVLSIYACTLLGVTLLQPLIFKPALKQLAGVAPEISGDQRRLWLSTGLGLVIPTLFLEVSVDTIVVLASVVLEPDQIAVLGIVLRIQGLILFGVTSINMVIGPRIANAHGKDDRAAVDQLLALSWHLKFWPSVIVLAGLALFGDRILAIFGAGYAEHVTPLLIASLTPIIMAAFGPVVLFVTILGLQTLANRIFATAIAMLALLIFALGTRFGVNGVTAAIVIVWVFWHVALSWIIRQRSSYTTWRLMP